jgi:hypothetical protein
MFQYSILRPSQGLLPVTLEETTVLNSHLSFAVFPLPQPVILVETAALDSPQVSALCSVGVPAGAAASHAAIGKTFLTHLCSVDASARAAAFHIAVGTTSLTHLCSVAVSAVAAASHATTGTTSLTHICSVDVPQELLPVPLL